MPEKSAWSGWNAILMPISPSFAVRSNVLSILNRGRNTRTVYREAYLVSLVSCSAKNFPSTAGKPARYRGSTIPIARVSPT